MTKPVPALSRRVFLAALLAGATPAAVATPLDRSLRPAPRPAARPLAPAVEALVRNAALGGRTAFAVADLATGALLEVRNPLMALPPASVAKAVTALYALEALGPDHRFATRLLATGPVVDGTLEGDLVLAGGGDPTLDTEMLAGLAAGLGAAGVDRVRGGFLYHGQALPEVALIDPAQPPHVGYNPAVSGLNLNFNRVHFEWRRAGAGYTVSMDARAGRYAPPVSVARMQVVDRRAPVYSYSSKGGIDEWTVARGALGKEGARWLPVRRPALYCAEVFEALARSQGIVLPAPAEARALPAGTVLAQHESAPLADILRGMLKYSTNVTAEAVGLSATIARGGRPAALIDSGQAMSGWMKARVGVRNARFVDHSGLGDGSRLSTVEMVRTLVHAAPDGRLEGVLKAVQMRDAQGRPVRGHPVLVRAKTGTLNFVSTLAGYVRPPSGRDLAFAIFSADEERRAGLSPQERDRPEGGRAWLARARGMQQDLIERWVALYA